MVTHADLGRCGGAIMKRSKRAQLLLAAMASSSEPSYTPVQIQKMMFLLDRNINDQLGGQLYIFKPYHYGPFDAEVYRDVEAEAEIGNIDIVRAGSSRKYVLTARGRGDAQRALQELPERAREYMRSVASFVQKQPFADLVASIYRHYPEMRENSVFKP